MLENVINAGYTLPPPVWSECTVPTWRTINGSESFHAHFNALFYSAHHEIFVLVPALQKIQNETYIKMRSVTTRRFKKSATFKQEDLISSKSGQCRVNLISRIEFVSLVRINFYQTHTFSSLLLAFTMPLATSVTMHVIAQKITDTTHVKPQ